MVWTVMWMPVRALRRAFRRALFVAIREGPGIRPACAGILIRADGSGAAEVVAAEPFRALWQWVAGPCVGPAGFEVIVPRSMAERFVRETGRSDDGRVVIGVGDGTVALQWGKHHLSADAVNDEFPPYRRFTLEPGEARPYVLCLRAGELASAIRAATRRAREVERARAAAEGYKRRIFVRAQFAEPSDGTVRVMFRSPVYYPDDYVIYTCVDLWAEHVGTPRVVVLNAEFLAQFIRHAGPMRTLDIHIGADDQPVVVMPDGDRDTQYIFIPIVGPVPSTAGATGT